MLPIRRNRKVIRIINNEFNLNLKAQHKRSEKSTGQGIFVFASHVTTNLALYDYDYMYIEN